MGWMAKMGEWMSSRSCRKAKDAHAARALHPQD
jgi:hypothetical protein